MLSIRFNSKQERQKVTRAYFCDEFGYVTALCQMKHFKPRFLFVM